MVNISRNGLRVALPPGTRLDRGQIVDVDGLGPAHDPMSVPARVENRADNQAGLQMMIGDPALATRVERYVDSLTGGNL